MITEHDLFKWDPNGRYSGYTNCVGRKAVKIL
jgi:hypothetical protein